VSDFRGGCCVGLRSFNPDFNIYNPVSFPLLPKTNSIYDKGLPYGRSRDACIQVSVESIVPGEDSRELKRTSLGLGIPGGIDTGKEKKEYLKMNIQ